MAIAAVAGLAALGGAALGGLVTSFAVGLGFFALGAGLSIVSRALMPKPDMSGGMGGVTGTIKEAAASRKLIYGKARAGGAVVFLGNTNSNDYLHMVICYAAHEIDSFEEFYFNDEKVWENGSYQDDWGSWARINTYNGDQTTADSSLVSESQFWTNDHVLNGIAYAYVRLKWDKERKKFPNGVPNISAVIKGKKVYDPRSGTTAWSDNPALCLADYMTDTKFGLGETYLSMDSSTLVSSANTCDELVNLSEGGDQKRFTCNGVVDTASSIKSNAEAMLGSMAGRVSLSGGKYFIQASKYIAPTVELDESVIVGDISIQTKQGRRSQYNGVKGVFLSEEKNFQLVDYPAQISSAYALEDGDPIYLDMPLPFVTNNVRAQQIAKIALLKSRQQTTVQIPVNLVGLQLKAGDSVSITNARMGWDSKAFEINGYSLSANQDGSIVVNLEAMETAPEIYDWTTNDQQDFLSGGETDLYDGSFVAPPTDLVLTPSTAIAGDGTVVPALIISWTASVDGYVEYYEVTVQDNSAISSTQFTTTGTSLLVQPIRDGVNYTITVRAVNAMGSKSAPLSNNILGQGDVSPPAVPTALTASGGYKQNIISWVNPTDLDFKHVEIHASASVGGTYSLIGVSSGDEFVHPINGFGITRYYKVRAFDFSGNGSEFTSPVSATTEFVDSDAFTDEVTQLFSNANVNQIEIYASLPLSGEYVGQVIFLTSDNKLYRWTGSQWVNSVPAADITGTLTNAQIASIDAAKLTSQIVGTQIQNGAISTAKIAAGAVSANEIAANAIVADKIAANAITSAKIAAGTIVASDIAAGTITGDKITANTITGGLLATAGIITSTAQINDGLITNAKIGNAAITTAKIGSAEVGTIQIAGNAVIPSQFEISSGSITLSTGYQTVISQTVTAPSGIGSMRLIIMIVFELSPTNATAVTVRSAIYSGGTLHTDNAVTLANNGLHATIIGSYPVSAGSTNTVNGRLRVDSGSKPIGYTAKMIVMSAKR